MSPHASHMKPVGDILTLEYGKPLPKGDRCTDSKFPAYGANGIKCHAKEPYWNKPSIIVGRKGTAGAVTLVKAGFWPLDVTYYVTFDEHEHDLKFLYYALVAMDLPSLATGVKPGINRNKVYAEQGYFPALVEQKRIVAILDQAFAGIDKAIAHTEKNLANARELFEGYLNSTFNDPENDWPKIALKDACTDYGRGKSKHRPRNDPKLYGGEYPFIQTGDIRNSDHFITSYSTTYNDTGLAQSKLWPKGTICITIAANIAETGVLMFDACFPDSVIGLVPDPQRASSAYIEFLLQSFKASIQAKGKGSAQANINLGTFENLRFPFPDLETQQQIVSDLHKLREQSLKLESVQQRKLTALTHLKQSLLHKAFSGELTAAPQRETEAALP